MHISDGLLFDLAWLFFGLWAAVLVASTLVAFGRDVAPSLRTVNAAESPSKRPRG
jgi:hypothetical protein